MTIIRRGRPKWAVGYLRVSTYMQAEEGLGLEHQRERICAYALENGYQIKHFFQDIASGSDKRSMMDRPEFSEAVAAAWRAALAPGMVYMQSRYEGGGA